MCIIVVVKEAHTVEGVRTNLWQAFRHWAGSRSTRRTPQRDTVEKKELSCARLPLRLTPTPSRPPSSSSSSSSLSHSASAFVQRAVTAVVMSSTFVNRYAAQSKTPQAEAHSLTWCASQALFQRRLGARRCGPSRQHIHQPVPGSLPLSKDRHPPR